MGWLSLARLTGLHLKFWLSSHCSCFCSGIFFVWFGTVWVFYPSVFLLLEAAMEVPLPQRCLCCYGCPVVAGCWFMFVLWVWHILHCSYAALRLSAWYSGRMWVWREMGLAGISCGGDGFILDERSCCVTVLGPARLRRCFNLACGVLGLLVCNETSTLWCLGNTHPHPCDLQTIWFEVVCVVPLHFWSMANLGVSSNIILVFGWRILQWLPVTPLFGMWVPWHYSFPCCMHPARVCSGDIMLRFRCGLYLLQMGPIGLVKIIARNIPCSLWRFCDVVRCLGEWVEPCSSGLDVFGCDCALPAWIQTFPILCASSFLHCDVKKCGDSSIYLGELRYFAWWDPQIGFFLSYSFLW